MKQYIDGAYETLKRVFSDKTYSSAALNDGDTSPLTTRIVYGVLEKSVTIDYILAQLVEKKPKESVYLMLQIGTYMLTYLDDIPAFATVNETVEFVKSVGKGGVAGFVNAVLKKVAAKKYVMPKEGDKNYLSITYSKPQWFVERMIGEYGMAKTVETFAAPINDLEHIRVNKKVASVERVLAQLTAAKENAKKTSIGGYAVKTSEVVKKMFRCGEVTFQSASSMYAVQALAPTDGSKILDLCSAPGGKAVYMAELCPKSTVIACDIHPHRVELIKRYAERMKIANVTPVLLDATVPNPNFVAQFDYVLVDAPCSCFGTYPKHPDVFMQRDFTSIPFIQKTQLDILRNAVGYLKNGGALVYSTCTLFHEENADVVRSVLTGDHALSSAISLEPIKVQGVPMDNNGMVQILPHAEWDGFFVAKLRKGKSGDNASIAPHSIEL